MMKQIVLLLVTAGSLSFALILLTRKVSCRHVCAFVSRQLSLIRRIALAKNQRALKPSAALSFAQTQSKS
jgi:hypothetical protein